MQQIQGGDYMGFVVFLSSIGLMSLFFAYYSYRICFYSPKRRQEEDIGHCVPPGAQYDAVKEQMIQAARQMQDAPCRWCSIKSHDGRTLWGRFYENCPNAPVILIFHGYRGHCCRDCAGGYRLGKKMGFNLLAVDQRSHGRSDGRVISFGIRERYDCREWIKWIKNEFGCDTSIILFGVSMGAATVLMASDLDECSEVSCILADCPYSSPAAIIRKVSKDIGYPDRLAYPFIWLGAGLFGWFRLSASSAAQAVKKAKLPILLLHGEEDLFVPCEMSREIFENCKEYVHLFTFPKAGHGLSYLTDPERYEKICVDFLWEVPGLISHLQKSPFASKLHSA
jgi:pimeloyl-ACP methyl ester carboxylesterase